MISPFAPSADAAREVVTAQPTRLQRTAEALSMRGFDVVVAPSAAEVRRIVRDLVPEGNEVNTGASVTLRELGITEELEMSGRYLPVRPRTMAMDRATQGRAIRQMQAAPDTFLASAQAVTEDGRILLASGSGSQIGPVASGAGQVILVIGAQKIVEDLDAAFDRLQQHVLPLETARTLAAYGRTGSISQTLVLHAGGRGRITVVLVPEAVGF